MNEVLIMKIVVHQEQKNGSMPTILKSIEGKQYTCTVQLSESNIKLKSCMYFAVDIFEGYELVENSDIQEPSNTITTNTLQV